MICKPCRPDLLWWIEGCQFISLGEQHFEPVPLIVSTPPHLAGDDHVPWRRHGIGRNFTWSRHCNNRKARQDNDAKQSIVQASSSSAPGRFLERESVKLLPVSLLHTVGREGSAAINAGAGLNSGMPGAAATRQRSKDLMPA